MRTIISAIAFAIVSLIVLSTSANAMSIDTHVDMDRVFYATTKGTYDRYHNLSVECPNGAVVHLDKVPHAQGTQFIMSIYTNKVIKMNDGERVNLVNGELNLYSLRHENHGTSVFVGEINSEELQSFILWAMKLKNNKIEKITVTGDSGHRTSFTINFENADLVARCANDISYRR